MACFKKLLGQTKKYDQDAFALVPVDQKEIADVLTVVGQIAIIKSYMHKVYLWEIFLT